MKKELLFTFAAFFFISLSAITGAYAVGQSNKSITVLQNKVDVTGDGKKDKVSIIGIPFEEGANFLKEIFLKIDASNGKKYKVKLEGGYEPHIKYEDLNHDKVKDLFISISTGGSGGLSNYYLYTLKDFHLTNLTVPEPLVMTTQFEENYKASLVIDETGQKYNFDLKDRKADYDRLGLYENGRLNEPTELMVLPYGTFKPVIVKDNQYGLVGVQRVSGAYHADGIAFVESTWFYENGKWNLLHAKVYRH
ncbi:hypothetical protein [Bacillus methanolicus]|uniref:Spore coat protein n=1 Tax=Bacillus methanolicus (strain MGA3 / ATCC 53907) TaxID=796606 RepID=A0A068LQD3_BACMM|nr:hypothetical protein [Bacillus methanolicus]AIE59949.1 hypothetical protein BMMGA3_07705 [Bacillus methanolicus MGA3]UQD51984.1 hypothetical protein C0971_08085 [Bacillus methanolicus]